MHPPEWGVDRLLSNSHYGRFDPRRAVLGLTASLRLLTGYLTGWNSKTTHVYAPPYGFTPPTPPKGQQFSFWGRCRINAHLCGSEASKRELPGSESHNESCCLGRLNPCAASLFRYNQRRMFKGLIDWYLDKLESGGYPLVVLLMAIESSV